MARYIDADNLYCRVKTHTNPYSKPTLDYTSGVKLLDMINKEPTADVVPRAEYDKLSKERDEYKKHVDEDIIYVHRIQAEIARGIFDMLEDECLAYPIQDGHPTILVDAREYVKLKKKYTEGDDQT